MDVLMQQVGTCAGKRFVRVRGMPQLGHLRGQSLDNCRVALGLRIEGGDLASMAAVPLMPPNTT